MCSMIALLVYRMGHEYSDFGVTLTGAPGDTYHSTATLVQFLFTFSEAPCPPIEGHGRRVHLFTSCMITFML